MRLSLYWARSRRSNCWKRFFGQLDYFLWKKRQISLRRKLDLFKTLIIQVLLHGANLECGSAFDWIIAGFINKALRKMLGIHYYRGNMIKNEELHIRTQMPLVENILRCPTNSHQTFYATIIDISHCGNKIQTCYRGKFWHRIIVDDIQDLDDRANERWYTLAIEDREEFKEIAIEIGATRWQPKLHLPFPSPFLHTPVSTSPRTEHRFNPILGS